MKFEDPMYEDFYDDCEADGYFDYDARGDEDDGYGYELDPPFEFELDLDDEESVLEFIRGMRPRSGPKTVVSVLNLKKYAEALGAVAVLRAAVERALALFGEKTAFDLRFDSRLGLDLFFSFRIPDAGLDLPSGVLSEFLSLAPPFELSVIPQADARTTILFIFKDVKTVLE